MGPIISRREGCTYNSANIQLGSDSCWSIWPCMTALPLPLRVTESCQAVVSYYLYTDVFSSDSKTRYFNRAVDRIRADPRALDLLGSGQTIRAFGEPTANKWSRNRPIA